MMQTSFPDLPYNDHGDISRSLGVCVASKTSPRTHPRTDLQALTRWDTFPAEIDAAVKAAVKRLSLSSAPFIIDGVAKRRTVKCVGDEYGICSFADSQLHDAVEFVVHRLGLQGQFMSLSAGTATIGNPDFTWLTKPDMEENVHPKVVVEYKTWWAAPLQDLPRIFTRKNEAKELEPLEQQSLDALYQTNGYMSFNHNKYGILTNWKHTLFLRRAETPGRSTLEYFLLNLNSPDSSISMLKAWVGVLLLANDDWSYAPPPPDIAPPFPNFTKSTSKTQLEKRQQVSKSAAGYAYAMSPIDGQHQCSFSDFRLCVFTSSTARGASSGCTVEGHLLGEPPEHTCFDVVFKIVDVIRYPELGDKLREEGAAYAALLPLQGSAIPRLYGLYEVWGILRLLALQPVGQAIPDNEMIDERLCRKMKNTLKHIHDLGYVHGDIARRNFCRTDDDEIFLIDLGVCRRARDSSEFAREMAEVDALAAVR